jgi:DNA-binding protein HU-beta
MATKVKRTTLRSSAGKKLYAVRDTKGKFKDIQSYKRAQGQDIKRSSKAERTAKAKGKG